MDFEKLNAEAVAALIADQQREIRTLDYKRALPGRTDEDKKEFLADVCSFANAAGGIILYGIEEAKNASGQNTGLPGAAPGLQDCNADAEILRLENMIRDGIEPRIRGIQLQEIDGPQDPILALQVPRSWLGPHMVTFKGSSRFYSRNSAGRYQLDVGEIRSAFLLTEQLGERIRRFRLERADLLMSGNAPVALSEGVRIVLHLIPLETFEPYAPSASRVPLQDRSALVPPMGGAASEHRFNFDGVLRYAEAPDRSARRYVQVFRNGTIETVEVFMSRWIPGIAFEGQAIDATQMYLHASRKWGLQGPFLLLLSLLGCRGVGMGSEVFSAMNHTLSSTIDRDVLFLPDIWIESVNDDPAAILRPAFDIIWQSCGYRACPNYDAEGKWSQTRRW